MAVVPPTRSAQRSGPRSSPPATKNITANMGRNPFLRSSMNAALRTV